MVKDTDYGFMIWDTKSKGTLNNIVNLLREKKTVIVYVSLSSLPVHAIILGYVTGNDYLKLDNNAKLNWLIGVMDGMMAEATLVKKDNQGPWIGRCVGGLSTEQIRAIFEKELSQNQEGCRLLLVQSLKLSGISFLLDSVSSTE